VIFDGKDVTNPNRHELKEMREDMQIIFQDPYSSLNPRMSVSETIMEPLILKAACPRKRSARKPSA
jgi:peptide/nickel transport system ATP-binding protein